MSRRTPHAPRSAAQRGAALLAAMLTVTLVATFAAASLWQQWRSIEVETAERARMQAAWILIGALDWSRIILRSDGMAGGPDHLAEPWAVPLQEARLSTFLAAEKNVTQVDDASTDTTDAFLSGQITDMQGRLNITNLVQSGKIQPAAQKQFLRLFERLNLPPEELNTLTNALLQAQTPSGSDAGAVPLMPQTPSQLGWLGLAPSTVAALAPHISILPVAKPVNLNTAGLDVVFASIDGLDLASAQKIVQAREGSPFKSLGNVTTLIGTQYKLDDSQHAIASQYFEVRGRLRLGNAIVDERSLVSKVGSTVTTVWRERGHFDQPITR